jgi:uncharacterized membrane protein
MDTPAEGSAASARASNNLTYLVLAGVAVVGIIFAFSGSALLPNNWYSLFKAIHVTVAVVWVGGGVSIMINGIRAQRTSDTREIVSLAQQAAFLGEKVFAPAGLVVFLMGIAMMINTNWGWGHFWVIVGLLGYAATFGVGIGVLSPLAKKIHHSAQENGPEHPETLALIERVMLIGRIDVGILLIVILDMVTKPFA